MTPLKTLLLHSDVRPDRTAFIAGTDTWSYRRLAVQSERIASAMHARGVREGDRVALHMANLPELVVAYYACFRLGAIETPLNIRLKAGELRPMLRRLQPSLYVGQARFYSAIADVEPDVLDPEARFIAGEASENDQARPWVDLAASAVTALPVPDINAAAVLLATSGTTGEPKFVAHTHATLGATAEAFAHLGLDGEQVALSAFPMMHISGLSTFLAYIRFGVPIILLEEFDPDAVLDAIQAHRCSWLVGLPFAIGELLRCQRERMRDLGSLRHCLAAGDVCPGQMQQEFGDEVGIPLRSFWASTEVVGALTYSLEPGPVSRIAPGADVRVMSDRGTPVLRGEDGEMLVRARSLAAGYWIGPGRIDDFRQEGWFHTGDIVHQGDVDDIWFVARKKELIVRGGSTISPVEVEQVLTAHHAVLDAAVLGVPDAVFGQRVVALVRLSAGAGGAVLEDIRSAASKELADYKVPERLYAVDRIPKNTTGKIDRALLAALAAEARSGSCCQLGDRG